MESGERDTAQTASDRVYEALRADIIALIYPPDCVLSRSALTRTLDVSPTPVREALLRLEQDGFVAVFRQSRTVVTRIDVPALHRAHILRLSLASEVATRLANRENPVSVELPQGQDTQAAFLRALFETAGLGALLSDVVPITAVMDRFWALVPARPEDAAHARALEADILACIAAQDARGAVQAIRSYLSGDLADLGALQKERPELFTF